MQSIFVLARHSLHGEQLRNGRLVEVDVGGDRGSVTGQTTAAKRGIDYLLTWNLRHLANATIRGKIEQAVREAGMVPLIICTPEELMESES